MPRNRKEMGDVWIDRQRVQKEVVITGTRDLGFTEEGYVKEGKDKQPVQKGIHGNVWLPDKKR